jgi:hypothetical protein
MTSGQRLRQIANVLNATTLLGLLLAWCARTEIRTGPRGLLVATGYRWPLPVAQAFTVGNVVVFRAEESAALADPVLLGHEERHSSQYAACLGLPFLPLYFLAAGWSLVRTGNPGSANIFERLAGLEAGGYAEPGSRATDKRRTGGRPTGGGPAGRRRRRTGNAAPDGIEA